MTGRVSGRGLALITGGTARIGAAIALRLADAGYALALHQRADKPLDPELAAALAERGCTPQLFTADLSDTDAVQALVSAVADRCGQPVALLVNNASKFEEGGWQDLTAAALAETLAVNLTAPVLLAQAVVAAGQAARVVPAVINIVDQRVVNPVPDQVAYSLSKQALWQATRTLALAMAPHARVNAVAPGLTLPTPDYADGQMERVAAAMPLRRLPTPADVADAVAYLALAEATTGVTVFVDGGAHLSPQARDFLYFERAESAEG